MRKILLCLLLVLAVAPAMAQQFYLGQVHLGQPEGAVREQLGEPEVMGLPVLEAATGLTVTEWSYSSLGLAVQVAGEAGEPNTVYRMHLQGESRLEGPGGLRIGMAQEEAVAALREWAGDEAQVQVGEGSAGALWEESWTSVSLDFEEGKVRSIWMGPGPE